MPNATTGFPWNNVSRNAEAEALGFGGVETRIGRLEVFLHVNDIFVHDHAIADL
jgi:hypothetical protein